MHSSLIDFSDEFIDRIMVYSTKDEKSDVDERETSRYSSSIKSKDVEARYKNMAELCKKAISEAEEIVFSEKEFIIPKELYG